MIPAAAGDRARKRQGLVGQGLDDTHTTCVHMRVSSENESEEMHLVPAAAGDRARVGQGLDRKPNAAADVWFVAHGGQ